MTYQDTIDYLFHKLPMFSRIGAAAYKKDLHNTVELCAYLGNPQQKFITIHIAGTNGKGSTSHMLAAILQEAGYKTGLYTSPHLKDFRERIKVNGQLCSESFVVDFTQTIQPKIEALEPSFFEITVAMAFQYFAQEQVDIAVIETGLGGRLDSTNIIQPTLSMITNIGWDHMQLLGNTLEAIAFEKAGIIKQDTPVVIGEKHIETVPVFMAKSQAANAPIYFAEDLYTVIDSSYNHQFLAVNVQQNTTQTQQLYQLDLNGFYQTKNLRTVLAAVEVLQQQGWAITTKQVVQALQQVKATTGLYGRWQVLSTHPTLVADVGHNQDGIEQILQQLAHTHYSRLHIVLGMVKDKDIEKVLALLPVKATYYFTQAQIPRALDALALQAQAAQHQLHGLVYENVAQAVAAAKHVANADDLILVCGSVFLVGELPDLIPA